MKSSELSCVTNDESLRLRMVIDSAPAPIHTARSDDFIESFNRTWLDVVGRPLDKLPIDFNVPPHLRIEPRPSQLGGMATKENQECPAVTEA